MQVSAYLSVCVPAAVRRVLRQEVEPEGGEGHVRPAVVDPEQLELADAHEVGVAPELREKEAAQPEHSAVPDAHRLVERVRPVAEAGAAQ